MKDFSDFEFKHSTVFRVNVDYQDVADVPLGMLEQFLLCVFHAKRDACVRVSCFNDSVAV